MRRMMILAVLAAMGSQGALRAQPVTVYDNLTPGPLAGYGETAATLPTFGDALTLAQGGGLNVVGFTLFNSTGGANTGVILTGTMNIKFYDNTVPYVSGSLAAADPLIANVNVALDFSAGGGLPAGSFTRVTSNFTPLNITLPPNVFITQQFTELTGTSTQSGMVLGPVSTVAGSSSPTTVYINSPATPEGLYSFNLGVGVPSNVDYSISVTPVPEPGTLALCGLAIAGIPAWRRRTA